MPRSIEEQLPTWMEYHQRHAQQLTEGRRAIEEIARNVVDASNEPDIHPDPHPLLDGGRTMADRLGPDSSIFGIGRPRYRAGADEFDSGAQCGAQGRVAEVPLRYGGPDIRQVRVMDKDGRRTTNQDAGEDHHVRRETDGSPRRG